MTEKKEKNIYSTIKRTSTIPIKTQQGEADKQDGRNHRVKDRLLYEYLEAESDEEITSFTDGYDAMFVCPEEEILAKYYKVGKEICFFRRNQLLD